MNRVINLVIDNFKSEYRRASFSLTVSEITRAGLLLLLDTESSKYPQSVFAITLFIIWLNYTLDIFIAKESFVDTLPEIELLNIQNKKIKWYLISFIRYNFVKYLIVTLISYITSSVIMTYMKEILDEKKIGINFKYRDILIQSIINFFSFGLYTYFLKFRWAYVTDVNYVMTMVVLSWCSMSLIMYMIFQSVYVGFNDRIDSVNNMTPQYTYNSK